MKSRDIEGLTPDTKTYESRRRRPRVSPTFFIVGVDPGRASLVNYLRGVGMRCALSGKDEARHIVFASTTADLFVAVMDGNYHDCMYAIGARLGAGKEVHLIASSESAQHPFLDHPCVHVYHSSDQLLESIISY